MFKKKFNPNDPPDIGIRTSPLLSREEMQREENLRILIDLLHENDDFEGDTSSEIFADILEIAMDISVKDWDRASFIILKNIDHLNANALPESALMDLIDLALSDPQIESLNKRVDLCRLSYGFKNLADVPEIEVAVPRKGALALLEIADRYAIQGTNCAVEVHNMRDMIDPRYTIEPAEKYGLH